MFLTVAQQGAQVKRIWPAAQADVDSCAPMVQRLTHSQPWSYWPTLQHGSNAHAIRSAKNSYIPDETLNNLNLCLRPQPLGGG